VATLPDSKTSVGVKRDVEGRADRAARMAAAGELDAGRERARLGACEQESVDIVTIRDYHLTAARELARRERERAAAAP